MARIILTKIESDNTPTFFDIRINKVLIAMRITKNYKHYKDEYFAPKDFEEKEMRKFEKFKKFADLKATFLNECKYV